MRCDQPQGLPPAAKAFLIKHEIKPVCCEVCKRPYPRQLEVIGRYGGFDRHPLHRYQLKNGQMADEFLQTVSWSSGQISFLGLQVLDGTEFTWTEEEIASRT
jgi:hypothetical protein